MLKPECWNCRQAIRKANDPNDFFNNAAMVGCDLEPKIESYSDAETMCPKGGVDGES